MKKFLLFSLLCYQSVFAQSAQDLLQTKLLGMQSMNASFIQIVKANKRVLSHSSGTMSIQRPGLFRWQIHSPMEQLLIADGKKLWVYDKDLEQVSVKKQDKNLEGTAALFLSKDGTDVAKDFDISLNQQKKILIFNLKAKAVKANFQSIQLLFNENQLEGLQLHDQLGQVTFIQFKEIQLNPKLSTAIFQFKIPKGVDVVYQ